MNKIILANALLLASVANASEMKDWSACLKDAGGCNYEMCNYSSEHKAAKFCDAAYC